MCDSEGRDGGAMLDENGFSTIMPPPADLPHKFVSRLNLWIPERESEQQLLARAIAARTQRDAYESRARYLAHVQAMAPLVNLPPVSVPSELFQSALSRAGIHLGLQKISKVSAMS